VTQPAEKVAAAHDGSVILAKTSQPGERVWRPKHA
jgi:hypothetical protein